VEGRSDKKAGAVLLRWKAESHESMVISSISRRKSVRSHFEATRDYCGRRPRVQVIGFEAGPDATIWRVIESISLLLNFRSRLFRHLLRSPNITKTHPLIHRTNGRPDGPSFPALSQGSVISSVRRPSQSRTLFRQVLRSPNFTKTYPLIHRTNGRPDGSSSPFLPNGLVCSVISSVRHTSQRRTR
jgi:hypothetical protein